MTRSRYDYFIIPISGFPAAITGAIAMYAHDVSLQIVLSNIIILILGWLVSCYAVYKSTGSRKSRYFGKVGSLLIVILYAFTFVDPGIEGVHRWITIGPLKLYISSIFAPLLMIALWQLLKQNKELWASVITLTGAILLVLQPDASQLTAFAVPMMFLFYREISNRLISFLNIGILFILAVLSWIFLDSLPSVIHVEEILGLVRDMGFIWSILGVVSLLILPLPFFFVSNQEDKILSKSLGVYFSTVIISTFFGNFPVPIMGYGISPILGYLFAITWLIRTKNWK